MTVAELIEVLRSMPQDTPVAVPDYANNQTSLDVELTLTSVYGELCVVIASAHDDEV